MSASERVGLLNAPLRVARPVTELERSAAMYREGLRLVEVGRFENHAGFDGIMLGAPGLGYHLELTHSRSLPLPPSPTPEDLLVFYLPDRTEWQAACASLLLAGFTEVAPYNPYWGRRGRTFEDPDGYRIVLQQERW